MQLRGWITKNGRHILIGEDGGSSGSGKKVDKNGEKSIIDLNDSDETALSDIVDKAPELSYFDDEVLNKQVEKAADSILDMAKEHEIGTEFAYIISTDTPYNLSEPIIGPEGEMSVKIPRCEYSAVVLHNHPSGKSFSARDIDRFVIDNKAKAICVIGNNGNWYVLEKTSSFNWYEFEISVLSISNRDDFAEIVLKGADKYGFKYYEKIN